MTHVFVYGTLKQGYGNHRLLESSEYVGRGTTILPYLMEHAGCPVVFRSNEGPLHNVDGEVYEVTDETLSYLDRLEGHPGWYVRHEVAVDIQDTGIQQMCWMYFGDNWKTRGQKMQPTSRGTYEWGRR